LELLQKKERKKNMSGDYTKMFFGQGWMKEGGER